MRILIVQFSDIHISLNDDNLESKKEALVQSFIHNCSEVEKIILIVSGDIAFSGEKAEYDIAVDFLLFVKEKVKALTKKDLTIIVIPGNHDCQLQGKGKVRETLIKEILHTGDDTFENDVIDTLSAVQKNYFDFENLFTENNSYSTSFFKQSILKLNDSYKIIFNCYNTALLSQIHEKPGELYFPVSRLEGEYFEYANANLVISVFHHPKNWLQPNNARTFYDHIEHTSDFALTGHEHIHSLSLIDHLNGAPSFLHIEGDVLQENNVLDISGYNLILIDLLEEKLKVCNCKWFEDKYYNTINQQYYHSYKNTLGKFKKNYELDGNHITWLNNPGANFRHPLKSNLSLGDIYIYPNLKSLKRSLLKDESTNEITTLSSKNFLSELTTNFKILVSGPENAGKTSLLKMLINESYLKELIPIYIEGYKLKETSLDEFLKVVRRAFVSQYKNKTEADFLQIPLENIAIFIDDFTKTKLNSKHSFKLLNNIFSYFSKIFVIGNEFLFIEEFLSEEAALAENLNNHKQYEIIEFGHKLRSQLVNKWNLIGVHEFINENNRHRKNDEAERIINSIIGPNLIPAYPIFLLTILQTIEAGNPHDLKESSYGHYYQVLIVSTLGSQVKKNDEIDKFYTYLSELAFFFFKRNVSILSIDEFEEFHKSHCLKYKIKFSFEEAKEVLEKSSLLNDYDSSIEFKYKYVYYFFVAKYFADHISESEIKKAISHMCEELHRTQYANIILFLTHHSKDSFILAEIIRVAKSQFGSFKPIQLEDDISFINNFIKDAPKLVLKNKSVDEYRSEVLDKKDEYEKTKLKEAETYINNGQSADFDIVEQLNNAFKTLEILGQILKNHYATIIGDKKVELAEEAYFIGLRTLNSFLVELEQSSEMFETQINTALFKVKKPNKDQIEDIAKKVVFHMAFLVSSGFIKKIATSVGSEKLQEVFSEINKRNNYCSVKLIDFEINLDFYKSFPISRLKSLKSDFSSNALALTILRNMVINYLYMYPIPVERKQQICEIVGISMQHQRSIEAKSKSTF